MIVVVLFGCGSAPVPIDHGPSTAPPSAPLLEDEVAAEPALASGTPSVDAGPETQATAVERTDAQVAPEPPASLAAGALGGCTVTLTGGKYWRSAILGGPRGRSPDGFSPMNVSVDAHVECAQDSQLLVDRASAVVGTARAPLRHPELYLARVMDGWSGLVSAGVAIDVTILWHDGPFAPRGSTAHAVVRFGVRGGPMLELEAPGRDVAFVS